MAGLPGHVDKLRAIPMFADLSQESLERIAQVVTDFEVARGQVLVQPGEAGSGLFIVEEGTVAVETPRQTVELGPGDFFGELSLLIPDAVRSARVQARTPARCLAVGRQDFERMLEEEPRIAVSMLAVLARRLRDAMQQ